MYVPFISKKDAKRLYKRKGGGGGGGGSKGGGRGGGGSSSSGSSSSRGGGRASSPLSGSSGSTGGRTVTSYGAGGGRTAAIPAGQPFAGRLAGGGTRDQVYGTQTYGSGYPGTVTSNRGVGGLGFPFIFWPVVWGAGLGYGASYLHDKEYGDDNNSSRPGGPMQQTAFKDSGSNNTFHLLADNETVLSLIDSVVSNCTIGNSTVLVPMPLNSSDPSSPRPEQAIQYYRASSIVLTMDGYNNTAALSNDSSIPNTPLPSWTNQTFLDCLNQTIGAAAPLVDDTSGASLATPNMGLLGLVWVLALSHLFS